MKPRLALALILVFTPSIVPLWASTAALPAKTLERPGDRLFGGPSAHFFKIEITPDGIDALRNEPRYFVPARVTDNGQTFSEVGIKIKGRSSFRTIDQKPSLTLKFDHFQTGPLLDGLKSLMLNNSVQDGTYLHELLATDLFRQSGVPASRVTHARVELNGKDLGLYVVVEAMNKEFLSRNFGETDGNLYEGNIQDIDMRLEQHNGKDGSEGDIKELCRVSVLQDPMERLNLIRPLLDVDRFLSFAAIDMFLGDSDGYLRNRNNYRIYHSQINDRMVLMPHGLDKAFINGVGIHPPTNNILIRALMQLPEIRAEYRRRTGELFTNVWQVGVLTNRINSAVARMLTAAKSNSERKQWQRSSQVLCSQITDRWTELSAAVNQPEPEPISFGPDGVFHLNNWLPRITVGDPDMRSGSSSGRRLLYIGTTERGVRSSWRTRVLLPQGKFRFVGQALIKGIEVDTGDANSGAGLRISGEKNGAYLKSDTSWRAFEIPIEVPLGGHEMEFICECRAKKGEVWFDLDSLQVVKD